MGSSLRVTLLRSASGAGWGRERGGSTGVAPEKQDTLLGEPLPGEVTGAPASSDCARLGVELLEPTQQGTKL